MTNAADRIVVTTVVAVDPATAFEVFTEEIDRWWRRGPRFRWQMHGPGTIRFEPGAGGRLVEEYAGGAEAFEVGRVLVWDDPARLVFEFRARNFQPDQTTEVEVTFEGVDRGTRVTVEHRGWDALPADHPARHGLVGEAFADMLRIFWADLLVAAREHASPRARR